MNSDWGFSSSSESDSDEDRPVSKIRTDTLFYQQYFRGDSGEDWPIDLLGHTNNHRLVNNHLANSSILLGTNGHANTSFANLSQITGLDESRIISPGCILPEDDMVLINEGGKFRPIRVISKTEILPPRKTPDGKTQSKKPKIESSSFEEQLHEPIEIPLELNDYVDRPKDPRKKKQEDECFHDEEDDDGLVLPRFWRETVLKLANRNRDSKSKLNGAFKASNSLLLKRTLERTQRLSMGGARRDPRLEKSLFTNPPKKIPSPAKPHNQSYPNVASGSIFDCNDAKNVSSAASAFSSSSESLDSLPSPIKNHDDSTIVTNTNGHANDSISESDDDNDCSFTAFQKRKLDKKTTKRAAKRTKHLESMSTNEEDKYIPRFKIDLKKKKILQVKRKKSPNDKKKKLFNLPPVLDSEAILRALTDDTASESNNDQENVCSNTSKIQTRASARRQSTKKVLVTPICDVYNLKNGASDVSPATSNESKSGIVKVEKVEASLEEDDKSTVKKPKIAQTLSGFKALDAVFPVPEKKPVALVPDQQQIELELSEQSSVGSAASIGSIEERLAEMTSPVKTVAEVLAAQNAQKLTDILTDGNAGAATQLITQNDDYKQLSETATEPATVAGPMEATAEDSGIQTAGESPPKRHSDSVEAIQSDGNYKNDHDPSSIAWNGLNTETAQQTDVKETEPEETVEASVPDTESQQMPITDAEPENSVEPPIDGGTDSAEMDIIAANITFGSPEVGANSTIDISEYAKNLLETSDGALFLASPEKDDAKKLQKPERFKIIIPEFFENGNVATTPKLAMSTAAAANSDDLDISDDDYEDDKPCGMDELTLPNSNTDRNAGDAMKSNCNLCTYEATKGWKQLTKHYVRKHPGKEISISRLASSFNPQELQSTTPIITKGFEGTMIQSFCYICDQVYNMCSSKWLMHFIAHTGEFEFRCNKCSKEMMQDLHKQCNSKGNERINGPFNFVDNVLYGYVCGLCSYVQLSENNIINHLKDEHQQLIPATTISTGNGNVIEIPLLKSTQSGLCLEIAGDDKNRPDLVQARERFSTLHQSSRYTIFEPVVISDNEEESSNEAPTDAIDLTLSDEDI